MSRWTRRVALLLVALGATTSACGGAGDGGVPIAEPTAVSAPAATGPSTPTPEILRFRAPRLSGGVLRGADYVGRDVALWFWAPW